MSIKYHQYGIGNEYGEDHTLTNNWNPDMDYGNEYANVYFRMETKGYDYPSFSFNKEDGEAFDKELIEVFTSLGWICEKESYRGSCAIWIKGKSHLYLHPQNFSGEVLKNDIKSVAEAIEKRNTFYLRWVDLYDTVYDISDAEYDKYLETKVLDIRKALFEECCTTRTSKFYYAFDVCRSIAERFRLRRIGLNDGRNYGSGQTIDFIMKIVEKMIEEGLLIGADKNGNRLIRSINKTEQKKLKIKIA